MRVVKPPRQPTPGDSPREQGTSLHPGHHATQPKLRPSQTAKSGLCCRGLHIPSVPPWKQSTPLAGFSPLKGSTESCALSSDVLRVAGTNRRRTSKSIRWSDDDLRLLGRLPDTVVARRLGLSLHHVVVERRRQGVGAAQPADPVQWSTERLARLGTVPDAHLANEWGISAGSIALKRQELGRAPAHGRSWQRTYVWTDVMVADLAALSTRRFAKRHGVPPNQVLVERRRRGIAGPYDKPKGIPESLQALLGTIPDKEFAARFGYDAQHVGTFRVRAGIASHRHRQFAFKWTAYRLSRLGQVPDQRLARTWGVCIDRVRSKRLEMGRGPAVRRAVWTDEMRQAVRCRPQRAVMALYSLTEHQVRGMRQRLGLPAERSRRPFTPAEDAELGTASDPSVARRLGRDVGSVAQRRRLLGISAYPRAKSST